MRRRRLLAGVGALGAGTLALATTPERSRADVTLDVTGDSVTLADGASLEAVWLSLDVAWDYELPATAQPSTVVLEVAAGVDDPTVIASAESAQLFTEAEGAEAFEVDLLDGVLEAEPQETDVTIDARMRVEDAGGEVIAEAVASDVASVVIEEAAAAEAAVGGDGVITIETR